MIPEAAKPSGLSRRARGGLRNDAVRRAAPRTTVRSAAPHRAHRRRTICPGWRRDWPRASTSTKSAAFVAMESFEVSEQDREAHRAHSRQLWDFELAGDSGFRTFVGLLDGEIVGTAAAIFGANAVYLVGGSTRSDARGRGVYRALVRARWDAAVARGTPALTVSAGRMSRPILEAARLRPRGLVRRPARRRPRLSRRRQPRT